MPDLTNPTSPERAPDGTPIRRYPPRQTPPPYGYSDAPAEWAKVREAHYDRWLGPSTHVWHEALPLVPHVDIHIHPPAPHLNRDFYTLITSGMSDEPMFLEPNIPAHHARAELLAYLPTVEIKKWQVNQPWYVQALRFLAHFPFENQTWLGFGHTIQNGTPATPYTSGSALTTALLLTPLFETQAFETGLRLGGEPVNLLWVTFLTDDEAAYKLEHGLSALLNRFQAVNYPQVTDVFRQSILA